MKWVTETEPETPFHEAAEIAVRGRLDAILEWIPLARDHADDDVEHVHQLRVTTRRADAALKAFRPCFRPKRWRKMRKALRALRQSAGDARTADVHLETLRERRKGVEDDERRAALHYAMRRTKDERAAAQRHIVEAGREYDEKETASRIARLLAKIEPVTVAELIVHHDELVEAEELPEVAIPDAVADLKRKSIATFSHAAQLDLPTLMRAMRDISAMDLGEYIHLHELRLAGKRLRYAIELYVGCFVPAVKDDIYPRLKAMQDQLGEINDCHELALRFDRLADAAGDDAKGADAVGLPPDRLARLLHAEAERNRAEREERRAAFLPWWAEHQNEILFAPREYLLSGAASV